MDMTVVYLTPYVLHVHQWVLNWRSVSTSLKLLEHRLMKYSMVGWAAGKFPHLFSPLAKPSSTLRLGQHHKVDIKKHMAKLFPMACMIDSIRVCLSSNRVSKAPFGPFVESSFENLESTNMR